MTSVIAMPAALSPSPFGPLTHGVYGHTAVRRFRVSERISEPHVATVDFDAILLGGDHVALGSRVRLTIPQQVGAARTFHGVIGATERRGSAGDGVSHHWTTVEPLFAGLRHTRHRRIFHDQTSVAVAEQILREHHVPCRLRLLEERPVHTHRIQYDESDMAFVERFLFEGGIFTFFDHPAEEASDDPDATNLGKTEVLVLCDTAQYYPRAEVDQLVERRFAAGDMVTGEPSTAFDITTPQQLLAVQANRSAASLRTRRAELASTGFVHASSAS